MHKPFSYWWKSWNIFIEIIGDSNWLTASWMVIEFPEYLKKKQKKNITYMGKNLERCFSSTSNYIGKKQHSPQFHRLNHSLHFVPSYLFTMGCISFVMYDTICIINTAFDTWYVLSKYFQKQTSGWRTNPKWRLVKFWTKLQRVYRWRSKSFNSGHFLSNLGVQRVKRHIFRL